MSKNDENVPEFSLKLFCKYNFSIFYNPSFKKSPSHMKRLPESELLPSQLFSSDMDVSNSSLDEIDLTCGEKNEKNTIVYLWDFGTTGTP